MIILTGASGGIGKEMMEHLLEIDSVIAIYNKSLPGKSSNEKLTYEKVDVGDARQIAAFVDKWGDKLSHITLIHAAAIKKDGLAIDYSEADWEELMAVNLKGNFLLTQALLPYMVKQSWGRIIHLSSLGGIQGSSGTIAYSAGKTALIGMSRVLAKEYARFNITSNILVLGYFGTGLYNVLSDSEKKKLLNKIPSKLLGKVSNISNAVDFLIKSDYVNGATINIDGGAD